MRGEGGACCRGLRGVLAWAGRQPLDACGLCSQLSNVPALPGDARPQPSGPPARPPSEFELPPPHPLPSNGPPQNPDIPPHHPSLPLDKDRLMKPRPGKEGENKQT